MKVPLSFVCLSYIFSAIAWAFTLIRTLFFLGFSWYQFWSFGSFADVGISLFGGIISSADLLRTGMYKASSNIFGVTFDVSPRSESMLCYLEDSVNVFGDVLNGRPWRQSTCTELASVECKMKDD